MMMMMRVEQHGFGGECSNLHVLTDVSVPQCVWIDLYAYCRLFNKAPIPVEAEAQGGLFMWQKSLCCTTTAMYYYYYIL